jgi:hypothetical protein
MSDNKNSTEQEKNGVGKVASVFGQSTVDGLKGFGVGAAIGAVVGAVSGKANTFVNSRTAGTLSQFGVKSSAVIGAYVVANIGGAIGSIVGLFRGYRKAKAAEQQFNEITNENRELKSKLSGIETAAAIVNGESQKSYVADLENQRAKQTAQGASVAG